MNRSACLWFAVGALTCAACFVVGGTGAADDSSIEVDDVHVRGSLLIGDPIAGPCWYMIANEEVVGIKGTGPGGETVEIELAQQHSSITFRVGEAGNSAWVVLSANETMNGDHGIYVDHYQDGKVSRLLFDGHELVPSP